MKKGYIQVYTGNGKGKTTAAIGLAIRAAGAGLRVYIGQFVKSIEYSEIKLIKERFPEITVELYGIDGCMMSGVPSENDYRSAEDGLRRAREALRGGKYDLVILDEITICCYFKLLAEDEILALMEAKPEVTELVLTGRYAPDYMIERADLVSEIQETRHYYSSGVKARDGIER